MEEEIATGQVVRTQFRFWRKPLCGQFDDRSKSIFGSERQVQTRMGTGGPYSRGTIARGRAQDAADRGQQIARLQLILLNSLCRLKTNVDLSIAASDSSPIFWRINPSWIVKRLPHVTADDTRKPDTAPSGVEMSMSNCVGSVPFRCLDRMMPASPTRSLTMIRSYIAFRVN